METIKNKTNPIILSSFSKLCVYKNFCQNKFQSLSVDHNAHIGSMSKTKLHSYKVQYRCSARMRQYHKCLSFSTIAKWTTILPHLLDSFLQSINAIDMLFKNYFFSVNSLQMIFFFWCHCDTFMNKRQKYSSFRNWLKCSFKRI